MKVFKAKIVSDNCQFYLQIKTNPSKHMVVGKSANNPVYMKKRQD